MAEEKNTNIVALQEKDVQLVVSKETIGQLTTNIKEVKARVEKALPMYDISNYSTANASGSTLMLYSFCVF